MKYTKYFVVSIFILCLLIILTTPKQIVPVEVSVQKYGKLVAEYENKAVCNAFFHNDLERKKYDKIRYGYLSIGKNISKFEELFPEFKEEHPRAGVHIQSEGKKYFLVWTEKLPDKKYFKY